MMLATVLLVSLTAVLPSIYQEGQREREAELIFRGNAVRARYRAASTRSSKDTRPASRN